MVGSDVLEECVPIVVGGVHHADGGAAGRAESPGIDFELPLVVWRRKAIDREFAVECDEDNRRLRGKNRSPGRLQFL